MAEQLKLADTLGTMQIRTTPPAAVAAPEILRLRAEGYGPAAIARSLNRRGVPTPTGRGKWWPDTVKRHAYPGERERWRAYINEYRRRAR